MKFTKMITVFRLFRLTFFIYCVFDKYFYTTLVLPEQPKEFVYGIGRMRSNPLKHPNKSAGEFGRIPIKLAAHKKHLAHFTCTYKSNQLQKII